MTHASLLDISEQLLLTIKENKDTTKLKLTLSFTPFEEFKNELKNDTDKKVFWINIYNAYFQILRKELHITKPKIYTEKIIKIAEHYFSLDDIEHGILRKYRYKYSLGFLANFFASKLIKSLAVKIIDYRIHFALNCGAKSCPPIAFYNAEKINEQLDLATQSFLENETIFFHDKKEVHVTMLFKWFLKDFGNFKGIRNIYKTQLNKDISKYTIKFTPYSWEENLDNFIS
ncbi:DUF547 domain-containing protein [Tenacibaculum jejuense]|uniref:DUF547 domain-containing protein n=1 Tax=Tenacibaculum jejuense TaxID=584609 RepID=A0A238UC23_9FLAO|nr:DUF547 domain-containing protein [Tenacibaculum jejuense]SNR16753.1 conserved protein of unknown function [Tenacibaculum jejuense]